MTLYLLKVHLQTFLFIPITQKYKILTLFSQMSAMLPVQYHDEVCGDRLTKLSVNNKLDFVGRWWRICENGRPTSTCGRCNRSVETLDFAIYSTDVENFRLAHYSLLFHNLSLQC